MLPKPYDRLTPITTPDHGEAMVHRETYECLTAIMGRRRRG
jgi:hypothetical protein